MSGFLHFLLKKVKERLSGKSHPPQPRQSFRGHSAKFSSAAVPPLRRRGLMMTVFMDNPTRRIRTKSPLRLRGGTAAERFLARHEPKREKRLWWVRCILRTLFHRERSMKKPPLVWWLFQYFANSNVSDQYAIVVISAYSGWETSSLDACATMGWSLSTSTA